MLQPPQTIREGFRKLSAVVVSVWIVVYMTEARPSSPEEVPPQEPQNVRNDFKGDSTGLRDNRKFHDSDIPWPKDGAGFH